MSVISLLFRLRLFFQLELDALELRPALHVELDFAAGADVLHDLLEVADGLHQLAVDVDDEIVGTEAGPQSIGLGSGASVPPGTQCSPMKS